VKNNVGVISRSVVNEHHGENRKHLKNHMKIGREPFCETFARHRAPNAVEYVKPYYEMLQVLKHHKDFLSSKNAQPKKIKKNIPVIVTFTKTGVGEYKYDWAFYKFH